MIGSLDGNPYLFVGEFRYCMKRRTNADDMLSFGGLKMKVRCRIVFCTSALFSRVIEASS